MNKTELIAAVAKETELKKVEAEKAINAVLNTVQKALKDGEKVQLIGFGTFEARVRNARSGKNPRTGETIQIEEARVPAFKAGKAFKDAVNK